jgi:hypothetical protein
MVFDGLRKKALRKFGWWPLRNEIDVTNVWICYQSVSCTKAWIYFAA